MTYSVFWWNNLNNPLLSVAQAFNESTIHLQWNIIFHLWHNMEIQVAERHVLQVHNPLFRSASGGWLNFSVQTTMYE